VVVSLLSMERKSSSIFKQRGRLVRTLGLLLHGGGGHATLCVNAMRFKDDRGEREISCGTLPSVKGGGGILGESVILCKTGFKEAAAFLLASGREKKGERVPAT